MKLTALAIVTIAGIFGCNTPAPAVEPVAAVAHDDPLWFEVFQELMCRLYKAFGGNCADLDWGDPDDPVEVLPAIESAFWSEGWPTNPIEVAELNSILDDIEDHLLVEGVTIPPASVGGTQDLIALIRGNAP